MLLRRITLTALVLWTSGLLAFGAQTQTRLIVKEHDGTPRLMFGVRESKPTKWPDNGDAQLFFRRHDVKDNNGRVVSGLGFVAWPQGPNARIAVFTLVPRPGAPNTYLAGNAEETRNLMLEPLDEFTLALGKSMSVDKVKALGADPVTVVFEAAPPRSKAELTAPRGLR